jgi:hypothetical protein
MVHLPLSEELRKLLESEKGEAPLTLNGLIESTEKRGLLLVVMLLALPFVTPLAIPGFSNLLGLVLMFICLRLTLQFPPYLPKFIGDRPLPENRMRTVIKGSIKLLRLLEKLIRPRRTDWLTWKSSQVANAALLSLLAFLLALPVPPIIPFTNILPGYSIIFLAASMMEEDGWMIWGAYLISLVTVAYFASVAGITIRLFDRHWNDWMELLRSLL